MEHGKIITWATEVTQELLQKGNPIHEADIIDGIITKFNKVKQEKYSIDKEVNNKSDLVIYYKGKPLLIYEFKQYFKPIRNTETGQIKEDFNKLYKAHQTNFPCKTYFVLVSATPYIEDAEIKNMDNFMDLSKGLNKGFQLNHINKTIHLYNRKRSIQPNFWVLSWEIK